MSRQFLRSTGFVGFLTLISRITGLAREMIFTRMFPTGTGLMDAFLLAYTIPNTLRRLFAEGAFSQAFVPVVSEYKVQKTHDEVRNLVDSVAGTQALILFGITALGVLAAPAVIWVLGPGFRSDRTQFDMAVDMLRWTFPYLLFISLTALGSGVLNSYGRFGIPAFTSVALNLTSITFAAWIAPNTAKPGVTLSIGVFVGGLIQLSMQIPSLIRLKLLRRPRWNWRHEGMRRITRLMVPAILGSSMGQISVLLSNAISTFLATGSLAWLYFADRLVEFPLGIFSVALATVILPGLSAQHAEKSPARFSATMDWALRVLFLIVMPASVALLILAVPLTVTIFHGGEFTDRDARMTSLAMMGYSAALIGWSLVKVLAPGYFARQDMKTPMRTAMWSLGLTMALNVLFLGIGHFTDTLKMEGLHIVLALTNAVGALVNSWLLYRGLRRENVFAPSNGWRVLMVRMVIANIVMAAALYFTSGTLTLWLEAEIWTRIWRLAASVMGGATVYFATLWLVGVRTDHFRFHAPET